MPRLKAKTVLIVVTNKQTIGEYILFLIAQSRSKVVLSTCFMVANYNVRQVFELPIVAN